MHHTHCTSNSIYVCILFHMCRKSPQRAWWSLYLRILGDRSTAISYHCVSFLSVVSKIFEKLITNRLVDHLKKYIWPLSTAGLLTVVSERIGRVFNRSGVTLAVALDLSKAFNWVWHAGLLHKLKFYGISGRVFGRVLSSLNSRWLWMVLYGKSSQEYPIND